jgi:Tol biopolymer transport system component
MRLTFDPGEDETPIWTPDGKWIVYTSTRADVARAIYRKAADGSGPEILVWKGTGHVHLGGITPDGKTLVVSRAENNAFDLAAISVDDGKFEPLTSTPFGEFDAALSRDGRWLAYASDESSRPEIFVRSFSSLNGRWQVSTDGGTEPVWSRDGRTLYYRGSGKLMAVDIAQGPAFTPSAPRVVFDDRFASTQTLSHTCYDTMPDGSLLMVQEAADRIAIKHINVVLNFFGRPSR